MTNELQKISESADAKRTRQRRSIDERIAQHEAELAALRAKEALKMVRSTEEGLRLTEQRDAIRDSLRGAKLILSDGTQGHAHRIAKKREWIDRYNREMAEAQETLENGEAQMAAIESEIQELAESLSQEG